MPYKSFPYPNLLYHMVLHMNQQNYEVDAYKEWMMVDTKKYMPISFMDYSLGSIINAFMVLDSWVKRTKKLIDLKQEEIEFRSNGIIMFGWISKRYEGKKEKLYTNYNNALFSRNTYREVF